ncbi:hypothetical protein HPB47_015352 [Ixodes persulcatus]|uniref:Uncharacterized protein n=1 Tax=Ixodes persulcatus TaxID=34615 RepID=A0AC60QTR9_IXOPE|nr:hypothetical protein HPB47_015352 [Ixodes persulcatus]
MKPFKDALCQVWALFFWEGAVTPKGNPHKPFSQDVVRFVFKAWASISEDNERCSFKRCSISTGLDRSEDCELNDRLQSIDDEVPKESESLTDEALGLISDSTLLELQLTPVQIGLSDSFPWVRLTSSDLPGGGQKLVQVLAGMNECSATRQLADHSLHPAERLRSRAAQRRPAMCGPQPTRVPEARENPESLVIDFDPSILTWVSPPHYTDPLSSAQFGENASAAASSEATSSVPAATDSSQDADVLDSN